MQWPTDACACPSTCPYSCLPACRTPPDTQGIDYCAGMLMDNWTVPPALYGKAPGKADLDATFMRDVADVKGAARGSRSPRPLAMAPNSFSWARPAGQGWSWVRARRSTICAGSWASTTLRTTRPLSTKVGVGAYACPIACAGVG